MNNVFDVASLIESRSNLEQDNPRAEGALASDRNFNSVLSRPLHNGRSAGYLLKAEKPEHRFITLLAAQGFTPKEIAEQTGYSTVMINYVIKQEWAQEFIVGAMAESGGQGIEVALKHAAVKAALGMEDLLQRAQEAKQLEVERKVRKDMQDRWFGTAAQVVQHVQVDPSDLTDEELAKLATNGKTN